MGADGAGVCTAPAFGGGQSDPAAGAGAAPASGGAGAGFGNPAGWSGARDGPVAVGCWGLETGCGAGGAQVVELADSGKEVVVVAFAAGAGVGCAGAAAGWAGRGEVVGGCVCVGVGGFAAVVSEDSMPVAGSEDEVVVVGPISSGRLAFTGAELYVGIEDILCC